MVPILGGNSEHVAQVLGKIGLFGEFREFRPDRLQLFLIGGLLTFKIEM